MLAAEWPWEFYLGIADNVRLSYAGKAHTLIDVDLDAAAFAVTGPLRIAFRTASWSVEYDAAVGNGSVTYTPVGSEAQVTTARTQRPLSEFLNEHGLTLLFEQDLVLEPSGFLLRPDRSLPPFSLDLLERHRLDRHRLADRVARPRAQPIIDPGPRHRAHQCMR